MAHRKEWRLKKRRTENDVTVTNQLPFELPLDLKDLDLCEELIKNADQRAVLEAILSRKTGCVADPKERARIIIKSLFQDEVFSSLYWDTEKTKLPTAMAVKKIPDFKVFSEIARSKYTYTAYVYLRYLSAKFGVLFKNLKTCPKLTQRISLRNGSANRFVVFDRS